MAIHSDFKALASTSLEGGQAQIFVQVLGPRTTQVLIVALQATSTGHSVFDNTINYTGKQKQQEAVAALAGS